MLVRVCGTAPGLLTVTVYPSAEPGATSGLSAVLDKLRGAAPTGEKMVRLEMVVVPVAATAAAQLRPMPLSMISPQRHVSGSCALAPTAAQTSENPPSR